MTKLEVLELLQKLFSSYPAVLADIEKALKETRELCPKCGGEGRILMRALYTDEWSNVLCRHCDGTGLA